MTDSVLPAKHLAGAAEASEQDAVTQGVTETWAICCSGGGIRSASYCLGALQWLEEKKFLDNARLILGVSGGSYIAASRALVARGLELERDTAGWPAYAAYAPGSPEEEHLRDNTRYLLPDAKTLLAGVLSLLFGVAVTLVLVLTPVFAVAHAWGWLLRCQGVLTYALAGRTRTPQWTATLTGTAWWIWPVITAGVTCVIFLWWRVTLIPGPRSQARCTQIAVKSLGWAAFVTLVLALAMFVVPPVIAWLSGSHSGALNAVLNGLGFGSGPGWTRAAIGGFVTAVVAVSQSARRTLAKYNLLKSPEIAQGSSEPPSGLAATVGKFVRGRLLPWVASVLVLLALAVAGLRWVKDGAAAGFTQGQLWLVIGALVVMLVMRFLADVNRISLHDFYRWRLATAYAVQRDAVGTDGQPALKDCQGTLLSELGSQQRPELVMCTTANINAQREVPPGRGGLSFSFDPAYATLRGPAGAVRARTADYETLVGRRRFTLFDVSAISGAAFSPLMGVATRQAYRILFTATDLRLGVWLPHPAIVDAAAGELDRQTEPGTRTDRWWHALRLLMWYVLPHPNWRRRDERPGGREARLWAYVLKLRRDEAWSRQFFGAILYRALQPTLGLLHAEAVGHTSYRSTWMCVSDGGHYDNLGLVEALQRGQELGITHILVLDASGDKADTWFTLGEAIALARSDADTKIALDPRKMTTAPKRERLDLVQGQVVRPCVSGTFSWEGRQQKNTIVVCKLGWWTGAPWDVQAYAADHSEYPTNSTLEQLYDSAEFEAYRVLGTVSVELAIQDSQLAAHDDPPRPDAESTMPSQHL